MQVIIRWSGVDDPQLQPRQKQPISGSEASRPLGQQSTRTEWLATTNSQGGEVSGPKRAARKCRCKTKCRSCRPTHRKWKTKNGHAIQCRNANIHGLEQHQVREFGPSRRQKQPVESGKTTRKTWSRGEKTEVGESIIVRGSLLEIVLPW